MRRWIVIFLLGLWCVPGALAQEDMSADASPEGLVAGLSAPGREAFVRNGCDSCHAVVPPAPGMTVAERAAQKGPNLWYIGSKLRREWLEGWLEKPAPISGIRYDSMVPEPHDLVHPKVNKADLAEITGYLMALTDPRITAGVFAEVTPKQQRMARFKGRLLFGKQQQCFGCHKTRTRYGVEVGGVTGPSLIEASTRLNPDWVYAFLMQPTRYTPVPRMPIYAGDIFVDYGANEMANLTIYLTGVEP